MTAFDHRVHVENERQRQQRGNPQPNGTAPPARVVKPIDFTALPEVEPPLRRFIVGGWLPAPCLSSLYGGPGIGKSLLAQQAATCIATGREFFGCAVDRTPVLGIFAEDEDEELIRRQWRINRALGLKFVDLADLHLEGASGLDNMLCNLAGKTPEFGPLYAPLIAKAKELKAGAIILDNRAQLFLCNENDRAEATYSGNLAAGIARSINGSVLLLGHDAKNSESEYSGSTAWDAVTRSRWWLHRVENGKDEEPDLVLERRKNNYAPPESVKLTWRDGVLRAADPDHMTPADVLALKLRQGAACEAFLQALYALTARGCTTSDSPNAGNYAPKRILCDELAPGFSKRELEQAMRQLFAEDRIEANVRLFKAGNRHQRFGLARKAAASPPPAEEPEDP